MGLVPDELVVAVTLERRTTPPGEPVTRAETPKGDSPKVFFLSFFDQPFFVFFFFF